MRPRVFPAEDLTLTSPADDRQPRFNEAAGIPRGRPPRMRRPSRPPPKRFNEAAGIPRGRPPGPQVVGPRLEDASMRPRVFPAEDLAGDSGERRHGSASMRPRVFPAEDPAGRPHPPRPEPHASMRPRVFPAEDPVGPTRVGGRRWASMRPRVFPAEDRPPRPNQLPELAALQ